MWPQIVDYFNANPAIFGVVCGAVLLIIISIIALCITSAKAKKKAQAIPAPAQELCEEQPAVEQAETSVATPVEAPIKEIEEEVLPETVTPPCAKDDISKKESAEKEIAEEAPEQKTTDKKAVKNTTTARKIESFKKAMKDVAPLPEEEDEIEKAAKYSGKWTICRVLNAEDTDAKDTEEFFFFELRASNGERLLSSEEYTSYQGALGGIETHKANILKDNFRITLSKKGDYIFKLMSGKNMLLCMGENYATKARCESAIESTKRFAKTAIIDENIQDIIVTPPEEDDGDIAPPAEGYNGKWIVRSDIGADSEEVFYFELFASNGEKLLSSEEYTTYIGAINGIGTHKANIQKGNFRITLTKQGDYIYKLLSGNGQLLCLGEHYKTKRRCLNAVESVKRFALNAPVLTDSKNSNRN